MINSSRAVSSLATRRESLRLPSVSITVQWCSALPASVPAHSSGTVTSEIVPVVVPADDLASVSLPSDLFARIPISGRVVAGHRAANQ